MSTAVSPEPSALLALGRALQQAGYAFVTVTPNTHRLVLARPERAGLPQHQRLREVFGWSRTFQPRTLPPVWLELMRAANALEQVGSELRSRVRFSSLGAALFAHSAFPTHETDAVFFGPDTYRFATWLERKAPRSARAVDIGCGSGAGGISIAPRVEQLVLADVSPRALLFSRVNAALAGVEPVIVHSDVLAALPGAFDLIIANPPYLRDDEKRLYRDGGGEYGEQLALRIVREALERLTPTGSLLVYTGAAIVAGVDTFRRAVLPYLAEHRFRFDYEELDPDVFGEELERPAYANVERIAAVGLTVRAR